MEPKTIAWVSYLTFIGWIIAFMSHNNSLVKSPLATFHLRQSFGVVVISSVILWIAGFAFSVSYMGAFSFYSILRLLLFILWILGFISAVQGERKPIPVVGPLFQEWFSFIK